MATVEHIHFSPHDLSVKDRLITYSLNSSRVVIEGLPQIFWEDGLPWREANLWAMERVTNGEAILKTVSSNLNGLLMRREMMSRSYTTKLDELWMVRCD